MAFFDNLVRDAGQPREPRAPGLPPTPSVPNNRVVSPAPATSGPIGRPPAPPSAGPALPLAGAATPRPAMPQQSQPTPRPQAPANMATAPMAPTPTGQPSMGSTPVFSMERVPTAAERAELPQGVQIQTPFGMVDNQGNLTPSPEGAAKYQEAVVAKRRKFGPHPFAGDAGAPQPPVELGRRSINPFTGQWLEG